MPLDINQVKGHPRFAVLNFEGVGEMQVEYYPAVITDPQTVVVMERLTASSDPIERINLLADFVCRVVGWWDLYDDGAPVPLKRESLARLPTSFFTQMFDLIVKDMSSGGNSITVKIPNQ